MTAEKSNATKEATKQGKKNKQNNQRKQKVKADTYHCCYCGRDAHTLLYSSTKGGMTVEKKQAVGYPVPLIYVTAKHQAICERCTSTHMIALGNGGQPVIGYDRGNKRYSVAYNMLKNIGQDIIDLDSDAMHIRF